MSFKKALLCTSLALMVSVSVGGCKSSIAANDYKRREVGSLARVEAAVIVSQRWVRISRKQRGITYVVRIEKTGETLALTQPDDILLANGAQAWVEFGNRLRVVPR